MLDEIPDSLAGLRPLMADLVAILDDGTLITDLAQPNTTPGVIVCFNINGTFYTGLYVPEENKLLLSCFKDGIYRLVASSEPALLFAAEQTTQELLFGDVI